MKFLPCDGKCSGAGRAGFSSEGIPAAAVLLPRRPRQVPRWLRSPDAAERASVAAALVGQRADVRFTGADAVGDIDVMKLFELFVCR